MSLALTLKYYIKYKLDNPKNPPKQGLLVKLLIKGKDHSMKYNYYYSKTNDMHYLKEKLAKKLTILSYNIEWFQNLGSQFVYVVWN